MCIRMYCLLCLCLVVSVTMGPVMGAEDASHAKGDRGQARAASQPAVKHSEAWHSTQKALERSIRKFDIYEVPLVSTLKFLQDITKLKIAVDWRALAKVKVAESQEVTFVLQDVSARGVLRLLLWTLDRDERIGAVVGEDGVVRVGLHGTGPIVPPSVAKPQPATQQRTRLMLKRKIGGIDFQRHDLSDVVQFFRDFSGLNFVVHWGQLAGVKVDRKTPVTLKLQDVPMSAVLDALARKVAPTGKVAWTVDGDGVVLLFSRADKPTTKPAAKTKKKPQ